MVDRFEAIKRLNYEKDFEEELAEKLYRYYLECLDDIPDLTDYEREKLREYLKVIASESTTHSFYFNDMLQMVVESGKNSF